MPQTDGRCGRKPAPAETQKIRTKTIAKASALPSNITKLIHLRTIAALDVSRELAYLSTASDVSRLNFRVRNESGCDPAAMAAIEDFLQEP